MWFLLADFEKLYKPHEPPRNPTLRYQNVRGMSMLWDPSRNEENQCLGFYDMTFGQVYILVCKIFCTHTTLNSIMSCFHFREKDSLSRAKTQTLLQEDMISNSHSTPGRNRSSRKRVSKIDVRRLNVSTFVFFSIPAYPATKTGVASFHADYDMSKAYEDFPNTAKDVIQKGTFMLNDLTKTPGWFNMESGEKKERENKEVRDNRAILFKSCLVRETCR